MEPHARYTLIGGVVMVLACALVAAALWISKFNERGQYKFYTVYFRQHSLSGLQVDGDVTMRGLKVGNVVNFEISPRDIQLVKVNLKLQSHAPVKVDTNAVINRNLLTGIANIDLVGGTQAARELDTIAQNEIYPVIPEGANTLEGIKNSLPEVLDNANRLLARASEFVSPDNKQTVSSLLQNLNQVSERLAKSEGHLQQALDAVAGVAEDLKALSQKLTQRSDSLGQAAEVALRTLSESIQQAAKKLAATADRLEDPRGLLGVPDRSTLGPGER